MPVTVPEQMEVQGAESTQVKEGYSDSQLLDSVKLWMREAIPVDPHVVQGLKPLTPTFRMLSPQEGFEPISPASNPRYGGMPADIDNLAELQEAAGMWKHLFSLCHILLQCDPTLVRIYC